MPTALALLVGVSFFCPLAEAADLSLAFLDAGKDTKDPSLVFPCRKAWLHVSGTACLPLTSPPTFPARKKVCLDLEIEDARTGKGVMETWWLGPWGTVKPTSTPIVARKGQSLRVYS